MNNISNCFTEYLDYDSILPNTKSKYFSLSDLPSDFTKNDFALFNLNIQSLNSKYDLLASTVCSLQEKDISLSVITLQETWTDFVDYDLSLKGFDAYSMSRSSSTKGGLVTYVKKEISAKIVEYPNYDTSLFETLAVEISWQYNKEKAVILNIYRPPRNTNSNLISFMQNFERVLAYFDENYANVIVTGDSNIDLLRVNECQLYDDYLNLFIHRGYSP